ncbi:hypothetical protein U9M48_027432 [Paspalum notatum var. saurae]|uniref:Uncharacterized protein n=1 Tax=Paspalum notatum var. saurae TaxID=547442 RepID=A0AAQ3TUV1_PASNO
MACAPGLRTQQVTCWRLSSRLERYADNRTCRMENTDFAAKNVYHTILLLSQTNPWLNPCRYQLSLVMETLVGVSKTLAARRGHKFVPDICHNCSHSRLAFTRIAMRFDFGYQDPPLDSSKSPTRLICNMIHVTKVDPNT